MKTQKESTMNTPNESMNHGCENEYGIQLYGEDVNPAARCPCVLLLDISGSMAGAPIAELNAGVKTFFEDVCRDDFARFSVETAIVTFGGGRDRVDTAMPFTSCADIDNVRTPSFQAGGTTPLGGALNRGLDLLQKRKQEYRRRGVSYYQPWMVLLTDGCPNDEWRRPTARARALFDKRKLVFLGVGVGDDADMNILGEICPDNRPPKRLRGLQFIEFFEWLSMSMAAVSRSSVGDSSVRLQPTDGWSEVKA